MADLPATRGGVTAAEVLGPRWRRQVEHLRELDIEVRARRPDGVHQFRVAARRLRSELAAFDALLERGSGRKLVVDLRGAATAVSDARDDEVVRGHLTGLLETEQDPVAAVLQGRLESLLVESEIASWDRSLAYLDSPAYDELTRRLESLVDLPPWRPEALGPAEDALRPVLRAEWARFLTRSADALHRAGGSTRDERLHAARKAGKRARYVAEAVTPVFGRRARRLGRAAERVQTVLGDHQDCLLTQAFLDESRLHLDLDDDEARILTTVQLREATGAATARAEFERLHLRADRPVLRAWMG